MESSQTTQNQQQPPPYGGQPQSQPTPNTNTSEKGGPTSNQHCNGCPQTPNAGAPSMPVPMHERNASHGAGGMPVFYIPADIYQSQLRCARGEHDVTTRYGPCGIITAIFCFPIGFLCLLQHKEAFFFKDVNFKLYPLLLAAFCHPDNAISRSAAGAAITSATKRRRAAPRLLRVLACQLPRTVVIPAIAIIVLVELRCRSLIHNRTHNRTQSRRAPCMDRRLLGTIVNPNTPNLSIPNLNTPNTPMTTVPEDSTNAGRSIVPAGSSPLFSASPSVSSLGQGEVVRPMRETALM
ncbi:hypothetical protein GALMADRAFT_141781 [Galerina marginata CBS 339.88]|uniref:Uncharacterized protein n=1 Tax=Galerina marginata (strain CBS 339.88) TaxID=685588 RepID=A0A067T4V2_GALM3|nr:hypothetical protein GALMADRAFT_141781 [Galerina marginata CBS 339.88]